MIRHIFIGTFKNDVSEETQRKEIADMKRMKTEIPGIVNLEVGMSTGWIGMPNRVVMTVDFATKENFDVYMLHPYHMEYIAKTGELYFDTSTFVAAQFEYEN